MLILRRGIAHAPAKTRPNPSFPTANTTPPFP
ncbi:MAG: hypothetical protein ACI8QF_004538 [Limisphaerales bacterium]